MEVVMRFRPVLAIVLLSPFVDPAQVADRPGL
jgi:hypothetical protein